jgi:hypothetical protein
VQLRLSLTMSLLISISSATFAQRAFETMAAPEWETLSQREQYSLITGVLLGATFFARSYDAAHPSSPDAVMDYYRCFDVSTERIRNLIERVYRVPEFRDTPFAALILRWDEAEREVGKDGE